MFIELVGGGTINIEKNPIFERAQEIMGEIQLKRVYDCIDLCRSWKAI